MFNNDNRFTTFAYGKSVIYHPIIIYQVIFITTYLWEHQLRYSYGVGDITELELRHSDGVGDITELQ